MWFKCILLERNESESQEAEMLVCLCVWAQVWLLFAEVVPTQRWHLCALPGQPQPWLEPGLCLGQGWGWEGPQGIQKDGAGKHLARLSYSTTIALWKIRTWRWCFPGGTSGKEHICQWSRQKRHRFDPWVRKIPWRMKWQPTPVFLSGKSHEQRSLASHSPWGCNLGIKQ